MIKKTFTLIELIIVVAILATLATIASLSISKRFVTSRNTNRISNVTILANQLKQLLYTKAALPKPSNYWIIKNETWNTIFSVGIIDEGIVNQMPNIDKLPKDPTTWEPFKYMLAYDNKTFQVWTKLEKDPEISKIFEIQWNYHKWIIMEENDWTNNIYYIYASPSMRTNPYLSWWTEKKYNEVTTYSENWVESSITKIKLWTGIQQIMEDPLTKLNSTTLSTLQTIYKIDTSDKNAVQNLLQNLLPKDWSITY